MPPGRRSEQLVDLQQRAREIGLWSLQTPAEFGGAGLSILGQCVVQEEAAQCRMGAFFPALGAFGGNPPSVMYHATPEQFERYARPIVEGRAGRPFTAISESVRGLRSRSGDPLPCRPRRRRVRRQRHQDVDHPRRHRRVGHPLRPHRRAGRQGRHQLLHPRRRRTRTDQGPDRGDDVLLAVRAAPRRCPDPGREPHRRGGRGLRTGAGVPRQQPHPVHRGADRHRPAGPRHHHRMGQAAHDVRQAVGGTSRRAVDDRRLGDRAAGRPTA